MQREIGEVKDVPSTLKSLPKALQPELDGFITTIKKRYQDLATVSHTREKHLELHRQNLFPAYYRTTNKVVDCRFDRGAEVAEPLTPVDKPQALGRDGETSSRRATRVSTSSPQRDVWNCPKLELPRRRVWRKQNWLSRSTLGLSLVRLQMNH
eukprot:55312-Amphidinium_carterae.1